MPGSTQVLSWSLSVFAYGALTLSGWLSHTIPLTLSFVTPLVLSPTTPLQQAAKVWAFPISLATTLGIVSFPLGT